MNLSLHSYFFELYAHMCEWPGAFPRACMPCVGDAREEEGVRGLHLHGHACVHSRVCMHASMCARVCTSVACEFVCFTCKILNHLISCKLGVRYPSQTAMF